MLPMPIEPGRLQKWLAGVGVATFVALACGAAGYRLGHAHAAADGASALASYQAATSARALASETAARDREQALTATANQLGWTLIDERATHAREAEHLQQRISDVTAQYRPTEDAALQPAPRCVFTRGAVRVWNDAVGADAGGDGLPAADPAADVAATAAADDTVDSGVSQADALAHLIDYGQRCRGIESQLNRLLDWHVEEARP